MNNISTHVEVNIKIKTHIVEGEAMWMKIRDQMGSENYRRFIDNWFVGKPNNFNQDKGNVTRAANL